MGDDYYTLWNKHLQKEQERRNNEAFDNQIRKEREIARRKESEYTSKITWERIKNSVAPVTDSASAPQPTDYKPQTPPSNSSSLNAVVIVAVIGIGIFCFLAQSTPNASDPAKPDPKLNVRKQDNSAPTQREQIIDLPTHNVAPTTKETAKATDSDGKLEVEQHKIHKDPAKRDEVDPWAEFEKHEALRFRTWTSSGGTYTIEAKIESYGNGVVTIEQHDGKHIRVALDRLSDADQEYVRAWRKSKQ